MSLATQVLLGLVLGFVSGIAIGEWASALAVVGRAFVLLLQMAVLPFVVVSRVGGLGRLDARRAVAIARSGGVALLLLWAIAMLVVLAFPMAFPDWKSASFFRRALVESPDAIDFLGLYIPANPFASLAQGVVPAIVVFSVAVGVALIGIERKEALLGVLAFGLSPEEIPVFAATGRRLERIRSSGRLRVGWFHDALPFAFRNAGGQVVGFSRPASSGSRAGAARRVPRAGP